jgi:hypothetical protein
VEYQMQMSSTFLHRGKNTLPRTAKRFPGGGKCQQSAIKNRETGINKT